MVVAVGNQAALICPPTSHREAGSRCGWTAAKWIGMKWQSSSQAATEPGLCESCALLRKLESCVAPSKGTESQTGVDASRQLQYIDQTPGVAISIKWRSGSRK
jgi:hypothetical protein